VDTLKALSQQLAGGEVTSRSLVEMALQKIGDRSGEGGRAFISVTPEAARADADSVDRLRAAGRPVSRFAGIPLAIKDLFDVAGQVTRAGSRVLENCAPATADATVIARLRAAGFIFIGRTNMTEFAYSGLGLNPHYGTPLNPFDRRTGRIPGGSTSGGAVAVTDGMAAREPSARTREARAASQPRSRASSASNRRRAAYRAKACSRCRRRWIPSVLSRTASVAARRSMRS